jgi:hypothetical protein
MSEQCNVRRGAVSQKNALFFEWKILFFRWINWQHLMTQYFKIIMYTCTPLMVYWILFYATHFKTRGPPGKWKRKNFEKYKMIDKIRDFGFRFCQYTKIDVVDFLCSPAEIQKFTWQDFNWETLQENVSIPNEMKIL